MNFHAWLERICFIYNRNNKLGIPRGIDEIRDEEGGSTRRCFARGHRCSRRRYEGKGRVAKRNEDKFKPKSLGREVMWGDKQRGEGHRQSGSGSSAR